MLFHRFGRFVRPAAGAAIVALLAAPAFAFGGMGFGGFHGGFHGAAHGGARVVGRRPPPPAIDAPPARPPFVTVRPPVRARAGFVKARRGDVLRFPGKFDRRGRFHRQATLPWGWWGGSFGTYAVGGLAPVSMSEAEPAPEPAICPELLTWSPRLGHATRRRLCDAAPNGFAEAWAPLQPRG